MCNTLEPYRKSRFRVESKFSFLFPSVMSSHTDIQVFESSLVPPLNHYDIQLQFCLAKASL